LHEVGRIAVRSGRIIASELKHKNLKTKTMILLLTYLLIKIYSLITGKQVDIAKYKAMVLNMPYVKAMTGWALVPVMTMKTRVIKAGMHY
jgi:hypothetical protein